MNDLLLLLIKA